jgi:predicted acetyltransferase
VRERGEAAAVLFASEAGIYGRYGYGIATWSASFAIETTRTAFVRPAPAAGATELLDRDDAIPRIQAIQDVHRRSTPGSMALDRAWLEAQLWQPEDERKSRPNTYAVHRNEAGEDDAFAVYRAKHDWSDGVPKLELSVEDLQALDPSAYAAIWRFLFEVDLVERVVAEHRPVDEPLLHLLVEPRRLQLRVRDGLFVRILDLPGAIAARGFAGDGRLVLDVADPFLPELEGRYAIAAAGGRGACTRSTDEPDLTCSVVELGAVYLGGTSFAELARAGRVREERPGAIARADAMFATDVAPWCSADI